MYYTMEHHCQCFYSNGELQFRVSAVFEKKSFDLTVFQNDSAWKMKIQKEDITAQSKEQKTTYDKYYTNLKKYFETCPREVEFKFEDATLRVYLMLKNKMRILYFKCELKNSDFNNNIYNLVDVLNSQRLVSSTELSHLQKQHSILKNNYEEINMKLNEFLDRKKNDETKLYNNFIGILNEKKRQIQHLNDLLVAFRQGRSTVNPPVQVKRKKANTKNNNKNNSTKTTPETSSEESDHNHDNYNTDDEMQTNTNTKMLNIKPESRENIASPIPSTSKIEDDFLLDDSSLPVNFPKRIRSDNSIKHETVLVRNECSSTAKMDTSENNASNSKNCNNTKKRPTVDFNTQDLLDNL